MPIVDFTAITAVGKAIDGATAVKPDASIYLELIPEAGNGDGGGLVAPNGGGTNQYAILKMSELVGADGFAKPEFFRLYAVDPAFNELPGTGKPLRLSLVIPSTPAFGIPAKMTLRLDPDGLMNSRVLYNLDYEFSLPATWTTIGYLTSQSGSGSFGFQFGS